MSALSIDQDRELAEFFTDVVHLRDAFSALLVASTMTKRLLVIHGVGGVGKSSLLRMFRLHCKSVNVPVALASGDEVKSALDVLVRWTDDLGADQVAFPTFGKTYEHYRALQARVENETGKIAGQAVKGAAKTTIETAASTIPGIGPLLGQLGGMSVGALADILLSRGFRKTDIDLLLDPTKKLTDDFLSDIAKAADKRRIVLMLDTFEQMSALDDWTREVAQRFPANMLFVIAGRALPNWGRAWDSWQKNALIEELKPMTGDVMRQLIQRYYATIRGGEPDPMQVEAIIRFAHGLPMVVTGAVQLWVKYGVEDFQSVKAEIVANLVDRLMEGVPTALIPALEAVAIVRWFDQPILRAVTGLEDVRNVYNELRRFPFVRVRSEGLALHDAVREIINENLRAHDSERYYELHERALTYFEKQIARKKTIELVSEQLYHKLEVNETQAMTLLRSLFEDAIWMYDLRVVDFVLSEAKAHRYRQPENQMLLEQNEAYLLLARNRWRDATNAYRVLLNHRKPDPRFRLVATKHMGFALNKLNQLDESAVFHRECIGLCDELDEKTEKARALTDLAEVYHRQGNHALAVDACNQSIALCEEFGPESNDLAYSMNILGLLYRVLGRWDEAIRCHRRSMKIYRKLTNEWGKGTALHNLGHVLRLQHRLQEASESFEESLRIFEELGDEYWSANCEYSLGMIDNDKAKWESAQIHLVRGLEVKTKLDDIFGASIILDQLGKTYWHLGEIVNSRECYQKALSIVRERNNVQAECKYLTALCLLLYYVAQDNPDTIMPYLDRAEQLTRQSTFWNELARLKLIRAHIKQDVESQEVALEYYQESIRYALNYNRYLLDEVVGRIIPHCLKHGEEGRQILTALRDWWQTGVNNIGTAREDTISPVLEGIPLLEAEYIARKRELGDDSLQKSVIEQIGAVLSNPNETA